MAEASSPDTLVLCDGEVWLLFRDLPSLAVYAFVPDLGDGVLRIIVDPTKPAAMAHVLLMLRNQCADLITLEHLTSWCRLHLN